MVYIFEVINSDLKFLKSWEHYLRCFEAESRWGEEYSFFPTGLKPLSTKDTEGLFADSVPIPLPNCHELVQVAP